MKHPEKTAFAGFEKAKKHRINRGLNLSKIPYK
jgi:hypothetical protein